MFKAYVLKKEITFNTLKDVLDGIKFYVDLGYKINFYFTDDYFYVTLYFHNDYHFTFSFFHAK